MNSRLKYPLPDEPTANGLTVQEIIIIVVVSVCALLLCFFLYRTLKNMTPNERQQSFLYYFYYIFIYIPIFVIIVNIATFAITVALCPVLVPIYIATGDQLFSSFTNYWTKMFFKNYLTFKYTTILCYFLFFPFIFLIKKLYNNCTKSTPNEQSVNTANQNGQPDSQVDGQTSTIFGKLPHNNIKKNKVKPKSEPEVLECAICLDKIGEENRHQIAFAPCGHSCCNECAPHIQKCHVCRELIRSKVRLYT